MIGGEHDPVLVYYMCACLPPLPLSYSYICASETSVVVCIPVLCCFGLNSHSAASAPFTCHCCSSLFPAPVAKRSRATAPHRGTTTAPSCTKAPFIASADTQVSRSTRLRRRCIFPCLSFSALFVIALLLLRNSFVRGCKALAEQLNRLMHRVSLFLSLVYALACVLARRHLFQLQPGKPQ